MRQFVLLAHEVPLDGDFSLDDLAGGAGRLDSICRSITTALLTSHAIREDVRVHVVVDDSVTIRFSGDSIRRLNPDERSTAALVRNALEARGDAIGAIPAEPSPGVTVSRRGLEEVLSDLVEAGTVIQLHEDGEPITDATGNGSAGPESDAVTVLEEPVLILSDHADVTDCEASVLAEHVDRRLRLGPVTLHAEQAITVVHHVLDTDGYASF